MSKGLSLRNRIMLMTVLVVFALTLVSGCASVKGQKTGEYMDDSAITTKVNGEILKDPDAHYFKIDVTTNQGEVVLQGYVNSRETEQRLVSKIKGISGVKSVRSLLKIEKK